MKKTLRKIPDFFAEYRSNAIRNFFFSGGIAVFFAFSFVALIHGDIDTRGMMANVANLTTTPKVYDADVVLKKENGVIVVIFGANAERVDHIDFTILSDPERLRGLVSQDLQAQIQSQKEMGVYHISLDLDGKNLTAGTEIGRFLPDMDPQAILTMTDAGFESAGQRYALTTQVQ